MKTLRSDQEEIARTIALLFEQGQCVEVRVPKTERDGVVSGYFTDHASLAKQLAGRNGDPAVYVTLNPVVPSLLARCANRVRPRARATTSDHDIEARRWMLIDCDPVRPAEISSTDAEHDAALERARDIRMMLSEEAWPAPVLADSGNGAHLLYRIELANDEPAAKLVKDALKALAAWFNDATVKVDETVFNAARITKAYGTAVRKGDALPERPHRLSRILDAPNALVPVPRQLLEDLARRATAQSAPPPPPRRGHGAFQVEEWIGRHHLSVREPIAHDGGRRWVLEECPFNADHKAPDAAVFENADGRPGFNCFHSSCASYGWRELRERIEGPRPERRREPQQERQRYEPPRVLDCAELLNLGTPAEKMLFDGYPLPAYGATLKVGASKSGKTVLAVQEAMAITSGKPLFDNYNVLQQGAAMIVEQDDPAGAASIRDLVKAGGGTADLPLLVVPRLHFGFGPALLDWLEKEITARKLAMVVLDSYTALRGSRGPGIDIVKVEQTELSQLDALGKRLRCAIVIIHHGSKGAVGLDWTQSAAGSFVMAAATEAQIHVSRFNELDGKAPERLVRIRGRHAEDMYIVLRFRKETLNYEFVLESGAASMYPMLQQIQAEFGTEPFGIKALTNRMGESRATAYRQIDRLRQADAIRKLGHGEYVLAVRL
jgi:hypothetical protein